MIQETIKWAITATSAKLLSEAQASFHGVSTDTRELQTGELFFCLMGERDGHDFAEAAMEKGAAALVMDEAHGGPAKKLAGRLPVLVVPDTLVALGDLAHAWRMRFKIPVLGLTGSNGKTTTKELIRIVLQTKFHTLATEGNLNNLIGVPKTLFRLGPEHQVAVIEMGMNDFGEIHRLSEIAHPTLGLITNIGQAHLEKLGGIAGVARAKGELFAQLDAKATAFVNLRDPEVAGLPTAAEKLHYGTPETPVWGKVLPEAATPTHPLALKVSVFGESATLHLQIPGNHNLENVLAALAVAHHLHIPLAQAAAALESFRPAPSRMQMIPLKNGIHLIDDCYNANPTSTSVALRTLADLKGDGKALAILGDMMELGNYTQEGHQRVGKTAGELGIDYLWAIGGFAGETLQGATAGGMNSTQVKSYATAKELKGSLKEIPKGVKWILVKGSRMSHLETVVTHLKEQF